MQPINPFLEFKVSNDFWTHEILAPEFFTYSLENFMMQISPFLRLVPQRFRDLLGKPVIMNTWKDGGPFKYRGLRPMNCKEGALKSRHKYGLAIDIEVPGMPPPEVLAWFLKNSDKFPEITTYEKIISTPGWNHFDSRFTGQKTFLVV